MLITIVTSKMFRRILPFLARMGRMLFKMYPSNQIIICTLALKDNEITQTHTETALPPKKIRPGHHQGFIIFISAQFYTSSGVEIFIKYTECHSITKTGSTVTAE